MFIEFMFFQLFPGNLSYDFKLFLLLELNNPLFDLVISDLLVYFSTFLDCLADLIESADDILCDFELKFIDIFVLDVFDSASNEIFVNTLAK